MGSSHARTPSAWGLPRREKPRLLHLFTGLVVAASSYTLLLLNFRNLLMDAITRVLSSGQISVASSVNSDTPVLTVQLLDGSKLELALTFQRSGLVSITVFGLLILLLMFPLEGSIWRKIVWLELGSIMGLTWSFIRLSITVLLAYNFGAGVFGIVEFFTGPFTDFFWIVSVWSLGLSTLISAKNKTVRKKRWF